MCSFLITNRKINELDTISKFLKPRGPDFTNFVIADKYHIIHNLLSITEPFTPQPFFKNGIFIIFNGEIYNERMSNDLSDISTIYDSYSNHGKDFANYLDGEFAIVILDFNKNELHVASDTFRTKPIFISKDKNGSISISTYPNALSVLGCENIEKFEANTTKVFNLSNGSFIKKVQNTLFSLKQYKTSFDDWAEAFELSLLKRTKSIENKGIFIGLSSGYDSGVIASGLIKNNVKFTSFTHHGKEDKDVLSKRKNILKNSSKINSIFYKTNYFQKHRAKNTIIENIPFFKYTIYSSSSEYNEFETDLSSDNGAIQFYLLCEKAKNLGLKVSLSGVGPDEIFSDYGFNGKKFYPHSNFGGLFPSDLRSIFPWPSFFGSSLESYIAKEEYIGGYFGIENRYPFLDISVIQEFLNLSVDLKNSSYKSPLNFYLKNADFPFKENVKIGF